MIKKIPSIKKVLLETRPPKTFFFLEMNRGKKELHRIFWHVEKLGCFLHWGGWGHLHLGTFTTFYWLWGVIMLIMNLINIHMVHHFKCPCSEQIFLVYLVLTWQKVVNLKVSRTRVFLFPLSAYTETRTLSPDATLPPVVTLRRSLLHHADVSSSVFELIEADYRSECFRFFKELQAERREWSGWWNIFRLRGSTPKMDRCGHDVESA